MQRVVPTTIVEPRIFLREGLISLLKDSSFKVIATAATPDELPKLQIGRKGLVIMGPSSGSCPDLELVEKISSALQDVKIVVIAEAASKTQPDISQMLGGRINGYIRGVYSRDILLKCLELAVLDQRLVILGDCCAELEAADPSFPLPACADLPPARNGNDSVHFSDRELEVLKCLASGGSNKIIGRKCQIAESTVKIHLQSILRKIQARNRTQAAIWAIQNGFAALAAPAVNAATKAPLHCARDQRPDLAVAELANHCDRRQSS